MTMLFLSYGCCFQALGRNSTWRELVRRDFAADDPQMKRYAAELGENAEAGSTAGASAVVATATSAASPSAASLSGVVQQLGPSPLALPASQSLPSAAHRARRESEWKRLYVSL
jgi:hypothetical protein